MICPNLTCFDKNGQQNKLTTLQYYRYKLSIRENYNLCLFARKLTQQDIVGAWTKIKRIKINVPIIGHLKSLKLDSIRI